MLPLGIDRCTGVPCTDPAAELCRRCERAMPCDVQGVRRGWIEPMARLDMMGRPVCEYLRLPGVDIDLGAR